MKTELEDGKTRNRESEMAARAKNRKLETLRSQIIAMRKKMGHGERSKKHSEHGLVVI